MMIITLWILPAINVICAILTIYFARQSMVYAREAEYWMDVVKHWARATETLENKDA